VLSFPQGEKSALFKTLLFQFFFVLFKKIPCLKSRKLKIHKLKIVHSMILIFESSECSNILLYITQNSDYDLQYLHEIYFLYAEYLTKITYKLLLKPKLLQQEYNHNTKEQSKKVKVKVTLVQALRVCTGRTAHSGSRGIALPFHDHVTGRE